MFSTTVISGTPNVLIVDASHDVGAWEADFCGRLYRAMDRRGIALVRSTPAVIRRPEDLGPLVEGADYNCICLFGPVKHATAPRVTAYVDWLELHVAGPKLLTACAWESSTEADADRLLGASPTFAPIALMPRGPVSAREAGLGLLKFYTELVLHAQSETTGRMAWFSWRKAQELLTRRGFDREWVLRT